MSFYDDLGIEPIINAGGTLTTLGGSLMLPEVVEAMMPFFTVMPLILEAGRKRARV